MRRFAELQRQRLRTRRRHLCRVSFSAAESRLRNLPPAAAEEPPAAAEEAFDEAAPAPLDEAGAPLVVIPRRALVMEWESRSAMQLTRARGSALACASASCSGDTANAEDGGFAGGGGEGRAGSGDKSSQGGGCDRRRRLIC